MSESAESVHEKPTEVGARAAAAPYTTMRDSYLGATAQVFAAIGQTGGDVGKVIVEIATSENPHLRYQTSGMIRGLVGRKYVDPTGDSILAITGARLG